MPSKKKSVSVSVSQQEDDISKLMPKKRGRRPKDKSYTVISNYKDAPIEVENDNIILHLPGDDKINNENYNDIIINTDGIMRYDPVLNEPIPYEPLNQMQSDYANILEKNQEKIEIDNLENQNINSENEESFIKNDEVYIRTIGFEEMNKNYFNVLKKVKILKMIQADDTKKNGILLLNMHVFTAQNNFKQCQLEYQSGIIKENIIVVIIFAHLIVQQLIFFQDLILDIILKNGNIILYFVY